MSKIVIFIIAMTAMLYISWLIQDHIHQGLGYGFGLAGLMIGFFYTVNELTKDRR